MSIETVAWMCGNSSSANFSLRKNTPRGWSLDEPLIRLSDHEAALAEAAALLRRCYGGVILSSKLWDDIGTYLAKQGDE